MKLEQTRALQILIFTVGFIWVIFAMFAGRFAQPDVLIALIVETVLLYLSVFERKLTERNLTIFLLLTLIFIPVSVLGGFFSEMVLMVVSGVIIYVVFTERIWFRNLRQKSSSTKILLAGIYSAGIFYILLVMALGDWIYPGVVIALIIEVFLLYCALFRPPPNKIELGIIIML